MAGVPEVDGTVGHRVTGCGLGQGLGVRSEGLGLRAARIPSLGGLGLGGAPVEEGACTSGLDKD